jgi:hypothetical protein
MKMLRIRVDFNAMTPDRKRVPINEHIQPNLQEFFVGRRVVVYEPEDLEVEAVLEKTTLEDGREVWDAVLDWSTRHDLS